MVFILLFAQSEVITDDWIPADKIVGVVDNQAICSTELHAYIDFFRPEFPPERSQRDPEFLGVALRELVNRKLASDFFKKLFVPVILPNILVLKNDMVQKRFPDTSAFHDALYRNGFTPLTLGEWIKEDYLLIWGVNRRFGIQEIETEEIEAFIDQSEDDNTRTWRSWLEHLSAENRQHMARDILLSRKIRDKLAILSQDLRKQKSVKIYIRADSTQKEPVPQKN
jgi:hypothetical protein